MMATHANQYYATNYNSYTTPDNIDINRQPITVGFLVSFLVDARGGAMRGCRHSGVCVIVPPKCAESPTRITCRYVRPQRLTNPPPLMEGEALASRVVELGPVGTRFLGPIILEVPHFASLRGKQREIIVLRSDNGETWRENTLDASEEGIQDILNHSFEGEELHQIDDMPTSRIIRILTKEIPHYFAIVSRVRQEVHPIGPEGGTVSSSAVPLVQAVFPPNALTKKIRVGLQAQAMEPEVVAKLLGHGVAVSPVVTVEPRRRKFHKAIMLSMPAPRAHSQGMINQYSGSAPTLRLLCSISGGQSKAVWEDVTGSTPLSFVKDCVSFTTTVSARFWLMDCRNVSESARMATELYTHSAHVPFMAKFVVFAKRISMLEGRLRVFCMTDDKEDKTLEHQEHFVEIAKSRDVEALESKDIFMEFAGNLVPILQSGDQPKLGFQAFRENRLAFTVRLKDADEDPTGRIIFMSDPKVARGEPSQTPLCTLNVVLPKDIRPDRDSQSDLLSLEKDHSYLHHGGISKPDTIHRADFRISDICNLLDDDWEKLAAELDIPPSDVELIKGEYPESKPQQAMIMFRLWLRSKANKATGNQLEQALNKIGRSDIVTKCICNVELVTDDMEKALAKVHLDQSGFETLKNELGSSRDTSLLRYGKDNKLSVSQDELDISQKSHDAVDQSSEKYLTDTLSDYLSHKKEQEKRNAIKIIQNNSLQNREETIAQRFNKLESIPSTNDSNLLSSDTLKAPPSTPVDYKIENALDGKFHKDDLEKGQIQASSTPLKPSAPPEEFSDNFAELRRNVADTLTFLHQERNDFLPNDDIIIPSRKDDHVAKEIDLSKIKKKRINFTSDEKPVKEIVDISKSSLKHSRKRVNFGRALEEPSNPTPQPRVDKIENCTIKTKPVDEIRLTAESEISNVIEKAEHVVNDIKNEAATAQEAFRFLDNEASSPLQETAQFIAHESHRSSIPVPKPRKLEEPSSPTEEIISKIPVTGRGKKTIKKHSKDPLKEFVKLSQDVNWDDNSTAIIEPSITVTTIKTDDPVVTTTIKMDPIVKTTITRITSESGVPEIKSRTEITEISPKSKIPVLVTETTRIVSPATSPASSHDLVSPSSLKSAESDSDSDSPPLKGILKKPTRVGSSSGSDVALHEEGSELSEDESEDLCQNDQPHYTETTTEEIDPITGAKVTRTIRSLTQTVTSSPGNRAEGYQLRQTMRDVLDQFMTDERQSQ